MAYDDGYDEADDWKEGHPLIATAIGLAVLGLGGYLAMPYLPHASFVVVVGVSLVVAGLIWAVAHFATMRHSGAGWTVASFVVLFLVTAGIGFQGTEKLKARMKTDMQTFADLRTDADGIVILPKGAESRGPFSKLLSDYIGVINADQRMLNAESDAIGFDTLADASAMQRNPVMLSNCGKIGALKVKSHEAIERRRAALAAMLKGVDAVDYPEEFKQGVRQGALSGEDQDMLKRADAAQGRLFDAALGACTVLARRRWEAQGNMFMFTHRGDLDSFSKFSTEQNRAYSELTVIDQSNQARLNGFQTGLRRELRRMR